MKLSTVSHIKFLIACFVACNILLCSSLVSLAQPVQAEAKTVQKNITIGDQIALELLAKFNPLTHRVQFPIIADTFNHFEKIELSKTDTLIKGDISIVTQTVYITNFDSGLWTIPALPFSIQPIQGDTPFTILSNPIQIQVQTISVDTSKPFKPIMAVREATLPIKQLLMYALIGLVILIGIILGIIYLIKKSRNKNKKPIQTKTEITLLPHEKALQQLNEIESKELWQQGQEKLYYTEITDTIRTYLEEQFAMDCFEKTTSELIQQVKKQRILNPFRQPLRDLFQLADMVKFAKGQPTEQEHEQTLLHAKEFILASYKKILSSQQTQAPQS